MVRRLRTSLYLLPALSLSMIVGSLTGCSRHTSTQSTAPVSDSEPKLVLRDAGEKAAQALFDEIGPAPFTAVTNPSAKSPELKAARPLTLAELPHAAFSLNTGEKNGGPGLIVFEPVPEAGSDPALADFASGCSDWLMFTVGGQPEMGQTPFLTSLSRARRELKLTHDLRLGLDDARRVAAITGASHVAIGKLTTVGSGKATLTYTIYAAETGKPVGKPLTISGPPESIRTQLPQMAVSLSKTLGITAPRLPKQTDATVADLNLLGRVVWTEKPQAADMNAVFAAAPRVALANLCRLTEERYASGTQFQRDAALLLTKLAPDNTLAWGHAAYMNAEYLTPYLPRLAALRHQYPLNYGLAHTDVWVNRAGGTVKGERRAAEDAVQGAPRNPDAWLSLGWTVSQEAHQLRGGRAADKISTEEWQFLHTVYPLWEYCVIKATELDPHHELAWTRLSEAATFAGDQEVAEDAFWKAETYSLDKAQTFSWGLQMFQQKWGGRKSDLDRVAQDAGNADYDGTQTAGIMAKELRGLGYATQADNLLNRWMASAENRLAKNPNDPYAHWDKGSLLYFTDKKTAACREYAVVTKLIPQNVQAQYAYAETLLGLGADVRSVPEYRRVLELDPQNADAPLKLGSGLRHAGKMDEAEKWYKVAVARTPNSGNAHLALGDLYEFYSPKKRHAEAAQEYARCIELAGDAPAVYAGRIYSLAESGKAQEAIHWGKEATDKYGGDLYSEITDRDRTALHAALGFAYMKNKQYPEALEQGEAALTMTPADANTHEMLGDTYFALGRRGDARKSWNMVVEMVPENLDPEGVQHARTMLAKYPENGT